MVPRLDIGPKTDGTNKICPRADGFMDSDAAHVCCMPGSIVSPFARRSRRGIETVYAHRNRDCWQLTLKSDQIRLTCSSPFDGSSSICELFLGSDFGTYHTGFSSPQRMRRLRQVAQPVLLLVGISSLVPTFV